MFKAKLSKMTKKLVILFLTISNFCFCQELKIIEGRILDEYLESVPGVEIFVGDKLVGQANFDGVYSIKISEEAQILTFRFPGMLETPVKLIHNCNTVEVIMINQDYTCVTYAPDVSKRSIRLDRKERKNMLKKKNASLEKLHEMAYERGLFKTHEICGKNKSKV
jgi:hypothetical protein